MIWLVALLMVLTPPLGPDKKDRTYDRGPLQFREFRGEPPAGSAGRSAQAFTFAEIHYRFRYKTLIGERRTVATLSEFLIYSVFVPERSWTTVANHPKLLAHEQGHFDIVENDTLRLLIRYEKNPKAKTFRAVGRTEKEAVTQLTKQLEKFLKVDQAAREAEQKKYDQATDNGRRPTAQADARKKQLAEMKRLRAELSKLRAAKKPKAPPRGSRRRLESLIE